RRLAARGRGRFGQSCGWNPLHVWAGCRRMSKAGFCLALAAVASGYAARSLDDLAKRPATAERAGRRVLRVEPVEFRPRRIQPMDLVDDSRTNTGRPKTRPAAGSIPGNAF